MLWFQVRVLVGPPERVPIHIRCAGGTARPFGPWGGPTLSIHNVNSNAGTLVLSTSCQSLKPVADAKLVFHPYGNQYFLAEVWNRHSSLGNQIKINSRQTELTKNQSKDEVVLIASEK